MQSNESEHLGQIISFRTGYSIIFTMFYENLNFWKFIDIRY